MRLTTDQIRAGVLHPDREVRETALGHFRKSFSRDPAVMPALIEAVGRYGWDEACFPFYGAQPFAQTAETVEWLYAQLAAPLPPGANRPCWNSWMRFLSRQMAAGPTQILAEKELKLAELADVSTENLQQIVERVRIANLDAAGLWEDIDEYVAQNLADMLPIELEADGISRYAEALARFAPGSAERILSLLAEPNCAADDEPEYWLQAIATEAAGRMRLAGAIPHIFERLEDDAESGGEWYAEVCVDALIRFGTDEVVEMMANTFREASRPVRAVSARICEGIRSELANRTAIELLASENEEDIRGDLCAGLLDQFDSDALRPVRDFILRGKTGSIDEYLIRRFVAVSTLMNVPLGDFEPWRERAAESSGAYLSSLQEGLTEDGRLPSDWEQEIDALEREYPFSLDDDEDDDADEGEGEYEDEEGFEADEEEYDEDNDGLDDELEWGDNGDNGFQKPIVHSGPRVGRNDPCPCGSGKKFKKCCMHKPQGPAGD